MTCGEDFFVVQAWAYAGVLFIVFGGWFARVGRLFYSREGGWRAIYAELIPTWGAAAAGVAALAFAAVFFSSWSSSCGTAVELGVGGLIVGVLSAGVGLVAIARLIRGRVHATSVGADAVSDQPNESFGYWVGQQERVSKSARVWRVPKLIKRVLLEYAISAALAIALGIAAVSV